MKKIITILVLMFTLLNVNAQRQISGNVKFPSYPNTRTTGLVPLNFLCTDAVGNLYSKEISAISASEWSSWEDLIFSDEQTMWATTFRIRTKGNLIHIEGINMNGCEGVVCYLANEYVPINMFYGYMTDDIGNVSGFNINTSGYITVYDSTARNITAYYYKD